MGCQMKVLKRALILALGSCMSGALLGDEHTPTATDPDSASGALLGDEHTPTVPDPDSPTGASSALLGDEYTPTAGENSFYRFDSELGMLAVRSAEGTTSTFYKIPGSLAEGFAKATNAVLFLQENVIGKYRTRRGDHLPMPADLEQTSFSTLIEDAVSNTRADMEKLEGVGSMFGFGRAGILGNRLWYIDAGPLIPPSDGDGVDTDTGIVLSTGWNIPVRKHLDFNLGFGYYSLSGTLAYIDLVPYTVYDRKYHTVYDQQYRYYYTWYATYRYTYQTARTYSTLVPRTAYRDVLVVEEFGINSLSAVASFVAHAAPGQAVNPFVSAGAYYVRLGADIGGYTASASDTGFSVGAGVECQLSERVTFIPTVFHSKAGESEETSIGAMFAYWYAFPSAFRISGGYATESENVSLSLGWMYSF
jgi:opacity protein-like surface antigen